MIPALINRKVNICVARSDVEDGCEREKLFTLANEIVNFNEDFESLKKGLSFKLRRCKEGPVPILDKITLRIDGGQTIELTSVTSDEMRISSSSSIILPPANEVLKMMVSLLLILFSSLCVFGSAFISSCQL